MSRHGAWPTISPSYQANGDRPPHTAGSFRGRWQRGGRHGQTRMPHSRGDTESVQGGRLTCGYLPQASTSSDTSCSFQTNSDLAMMLHKADRHLIYPPGGKEEVDRKDPLLIEERKEAERRNKRQRQAGRLEQEEAKALSTIPGLNIALSTPELIDQWLAERKKRWPSDKVVEQKRLEGWSGRPTAPRIESRKDTQNQRGGERRPLESGIDNGHTSERQELGVSKSTPSSSGKKGEDSDSDTESTDDDSDSDLSSNSDAPSEEPIRRPVAKDDNEDSVESPASQLQPVPSASTASNTCRFFLQGRCNYGSLCRQSHILPSQGTSGSQTLPTRRPRPRNPVQNPFEPKNLLHALLKQDIEQHVNTVAQVVRFLVRNDFLRHFEIQAGLAEAQKERRSMIRDVSAADSTSLGKDSSLDPVLNLSHPLQNGGLPVVSDSDADSTALTPGRSLYRPPSPLLRPLKDLAWPPEPDPMLFLDPLRRNDPKPLTGKQFEQLATDQELRSILSPATEHHPFGEPRPGLERALQTLNDLPSDEHQRSALELILGVSAQTPQNPHQIGPTFVQSRPGGARFIGEVELFKAGLRCGPVEQSLIRRLAQRISEVTEGPEFDVEPLGWDHQRDEGMSFREEKRRRFYEREADRRDMLRKLGIDVD